MLYTSLIVVLAILASVLSHPIHASNDTTSQWPDIQRLLDGNQQFRNDIEEKHPSFLQESATNPHSPPFMFLGCSDSRVSEGTVFDALPGTLFVERNIANQFHESDHNANAVLSYAVNHLGVKHIIVMGHYGCGGVAAAITLGDNEATDPVHSWIHPIREIYQTSNRSEIVQLRTKNQASTQQHRPGLHDAGFRALVEENVKATVRHISQSHAIAEHSSSSHSDTEAREEYAAQSLFIHGWVYNIETGNVHDLGVSVGIV